MPPKRKALDTVDANAKRQNTAASAKGKGKATAAPAAPQLLTDAQERDIELKATKMARSPRWAEVSGSRNLDDAYIERHLDPAYAYEFMCVCNPLRQSDEEDEDEEENAEEPPKCDDGKTCPCSKTAASVPSHPYTLTRAGLARHHMATDMVNLRNPDAFGMYTYNDHFSYGVMEVIQNMLLDFDEAFKSSQEHHVEKAWSVVEAVALFMLWGDGEAIYMADDSEMVRATVAQIARMALAGIDLTKGRENIKNVGWITGLYLKFAGSMNQFGDLAQPRPQKSTAKRFQFHAGNFQHYLVSLARDRDITLPSHSEDADEVLLMPKEDAGDRWKWVTSMGQYRREGGVPPGYSFRGMVAPNRNILGGDALDISSWSSAIRKRHAFDKKDPLGKDTAKKLKEGLILCLA